MLKKDSSLDDLKKEICGYYLLVSERTRLWYLPVYEAEDYTNKILLIDDDTFKKNIKTLSCERIAVETKISNNHWIWKQYANNKNIKHPPNLGIVGLSNLGNTCYMNATLQCLIHIPQIREYIEKKYYLTDLNYDNKYDSNCSLIKSFSQLVTSIYSNVDQSINTQPFKSTMESIYPTYKGLEQHDAQEFLYDLIEGLSDNLNFNHSKPYIENEESNGRDDSIVSRIWWINHLKRDCSVVEALFTGQFKSQLRCGVCDKIWTHFEAFQNIELSIPEKTTKCVMMKLFLQHGKQPITFSMDVSQNTRVFELCKSVCDVFSDLNLSLNNLILVKCNKSVCETIDPYEYLRNITHFSSLYIFFKYRMLYNLVMYPDKGNNLDQTFKFNEGDSVYYLSHDNHEWEKAKIDNVI